MTLPRTNTLSSFPFFHHKELDHEGANADVILFFLCILFYYYLPEICPWEIYFSLLNLGPLFFTYLLTKLKAERAGISSASED